MPADRISVMFPTRTIEEMRRNGFEATADISRLGGADAILICVPTPLSRNREPDLSYVVATAESLLPHLREGQLVVLEIDHLSRHDRRDTEADPGAERASSRRRHCSSPTRPSARIRATRISRPPASPRWSAATVRSAAAAAEALYRQFVERVVPVRDTKTAEAVKLTENIFRAVNIALVNELKLVYEAMGIDIWEVIEAARTKPFGFMPFYPGPGLGGHCIPIDPFYLTWKAREFDVPARFIELAGEINTAMPRIVVEQRGGGARPRASARG